MKNKFPVYVLSKGRADCCLTATCLEKDGVDFYLAVEYEEYDEYRKNFPKANILRQPKENSGKGAITTRNWIWKHSIENGFDWHWEFDDNILNFGRINHGKRINCNAIHCLRVVEEFTRRYMNIGIAGLNYQMFVLNDVKKPFYLNCHVYSALLIRNDLPYRWRLTYNADTDLCLQVLHNKWCTVNFNSFYANKLMTMKMKGGNTAKYKKDGGRFKMAKILADTWPQYVQVRQKFKRFQHHVNWKKHFKQPLIRNPEIDWDNLPAVDEMGIKIQKVKPIKSESMREFYEKERVK